MKIMDKEMKLKTINYFLSEIVNTKYPLEERKEEMLRLGSKLCQGYPLEWSDMWRELRPIDDMNFKELRMLLEEIQ